MTTISETLQIEIISSDGTPISVERAGQGPALILVHGTGADRSRWALTGARLAENFTVYNMDRRGRGKSGDAPVYDVRREYEDIASVAAAIHGPVSVAAHSFGAACALGAARLIPNLAKLALYEPPMMAEQHSPQRDEVLRQMDEALARGDRDAVAAMMMVDILRMPAAALDRARATPAWAVSMATAHTFTRELRASADYAADLGALRAITAPTLFLLGGESLASFKETTEALRALLPNARVALLPGQQHSALLTAPDLTTQEITRFLNE